MNEEKKKRKGPPADFEVCAVEALGTTEGNLGLDRSQVLLLLLGGGGGGDYTDED